MVDCVTCGNEFQARQSLHCEYCDGFYCKDHISRNAHQCGTDKQSANSNKREKRQRDTNHPQESGSGARLIAGAILIVGGGLLSLTGVGLVIGVPIALLGFGVMFPRFTMLMVILAIISAIMFFLYL